MRYEVGVVTCHPLVFAAKQVKTIIKTWLYARKHDLPCNKWYGVWQKDDEIVYAHTGCLPGAENRARLLMDAMEKQDRYSGGRHA